MASIKILSFLSIRRLGQSLYYQEYKGCIQSNRNFFPEFSARVLGQLSKPTAKSRSESRANTTCILENTPYTKHNLRQQTQFALRSIKTAFEGEVCNWILSFAHTVEHSFIETDLARTELQRLQHQIKTIRPLKKGMWQFSKAQQHGVMTRSQTPAGIKERDDKGHAAKAKKTNSNQPPTPPKPQTPSKLRTL